MEYFTTLFSFLKESNHEHLELNSKKDKIIESLEINNRAQEDVIKSQERLIESLKKFNSEGTSPGESLSFSNSGFDQVLKVHSSPEPKKDDSEIIDNNTHLSDLEFELSDYNSKIRRNEVLIYDINSLTSGFPIESLKYKLIRKENLKMYKEIIYALSGENLIPLTDISTRFETIKRIKDGRNFLIIIISSEIKITDNLLSTIRLNLRNKIKEIIDEPIVTQLPPISIHSTTSYTESDLVSRLNTSEYLIWITKFIIKETGSSESNIIDINFSSVLKKENSIDINMIIRTKYPILIRKSRYNSQFQTTYDKIKEKKEVNMFNSLSQNLKKKIDSL